MTHQQLYDTLFGLNLRLCEATLEGRSLAPSELPALRHAVDLFLEDWLAQPADRRCNVNSVVRELIFAAGIFAAAGAMDDAERCRSAAATHTPREHVRVALEKAREWPPWFQGACTYAWKEALGRADETSDQEATAIAKQCDDAAVRRFIVGGW